MTFKDKASTNRSLPTTWFMKNHPYIYNLPTLFTILPLEIREIIFEKVLDYYEDFNEADKKQRVQPFLKM